MMNIKQVSNCQFSSWYNCFKECTFRSIVLDIPGEVVEYLLADGLVLPEGCEQKLDRAGLEEDSDDETDWTTGEQNEAQRPNFQEFNTAIQKSIDQLGGEAFPKLNWSSPKDAGWISLDGSLKCKNPGDVYLLLKSSSFCTHDLIEPYIQCNDYEEGHKYEVKYQLVLKKWYDIHPGCEFRCFAKNGQLIGISQRHHSSHYGFLEAQKQDISDDLTSFYKQMIKSRFPDSNVTFDVYRKQENIVYLIDFNPFGPVTDALLFTWQELQGTSLEQEVQNTKSAVFRFVNKESGVQPHPYQQYGLPLDVLHLSTGQDPQKFIDLMKLKNQNRGSSDDDDAHIT